MPSNSFKTAFRAVRADTDAAQVVHCTDFFRYFEKAEEEFYHSLGFSFAEFGTRGLWFPRIEAFCQYRKSAKFNDLLEVELTVQELKEKSVKYAFRVLNKETQDLLAEGHSVIVAVSQQTGKATQIPPEFAERLRPYSPSSADNM